MKATQDISSLIGDLQQCNDEQIHLSGAIQGHGCLLFFTPDRAIQGISKNTGAFLNFDGPILGTKLDYVLESHFVDIVAEFVKSHPWKTPGIHLEYHSFKTTYDVYLFHTDGVFGLELEQIENIDGRVHEIQKSRHDSFLQGFMTSVKNVRDVRGLANTACHYVREISGLDRVMMYKFIPPSWHGEVIGEDRVLGSHSFLNHRFPSSDIPKPARDLYVRNHVRMIPDVDGEFVAVEPTINPLTDNKWDLSDSRLRSVSPVHLEYLRNMGIEGSMSFSVTVNGQLWGLIACHHLKPFTLSHEKRALCTTIADAFAAQAVLLETLEEYVAKSSFDLKIRKAMEEILPAKVPLTALFRQHDILMDAFNATGMALINAEQTEASGMTPPVSILKKMGVHLQGELKKQGKRFLAVQNISALFPEWSDKLNITCGALCVEIEDKHKSLFVLFRPEVVQHVYWGGDPVKKLEKKNFKGPINPRNSFETWEEIIRHQSLEWKSYEIDGIVFLKDLIFDSVLIKNALIDELYASLKKAKDSK